VIGANEMGLLSLAKVYSTLQELKLNNCSDNVLRRILWFYGENLKMFKEGKRIVGYGGGREERILS